MKKAMKFFSMAALCIATVAMVGCSKDEEQPAGSGKVVVSTTTIGLGSSEASKHLDESGTKTFAAGEEIAVVYENTSSTMVKASVTLAAGDISNGGKTATVSVAMTDPKADGVVTFIYPASMANDDGTVNYDALYSNQDGTMATLSSNFDYAEYSGTLSGVDLPDNPMLTNQLAVLKFTVQNTANSQDITDSVTKLTIKHGSDIYSVTPATSQSTFWVAVKPIATNDGDIAIYAAVGKDLYKKTVSSYGDLAAGTFNRITVGATQIPGAVSGLFRVNDDLIYFSQGNLRFASSEWSFFPNQYDYYTTYSADAWDKFGWSTSTTTYGMSTSTNAGNYSGSFVDWGANIGSGWRTPSKDEWVGVFNGHTYGMATVEGVHGIILLPYNTTVAGFNTDHSNWNNNQPDASEWATMEAAGAVFLPAAGGRVGTGVYDVGSRGYYWSSVSVRSQDAWGVCLYEFGVNYYGRVRGLSVRLVGE